MSTDTTPGGPDGPADTPADTPSAQSEPGGPATNEAAGIEATSQDRNLAVLAHLLGILFWFVGALVIWLVKKDDSPYVGDQAKEALNFQITIVIANIVSGVLTVIGIGCVMLAAVYVLNLVFCIVAAVAASKGEWYRYPIAIRLVS